MAGKNRTQGQRTEEERADPYWENLIGGIHNYGTDTELRALHQVMHDLKHADLHPKETNSPHRIGHGKGRHLPRRAREAVG